MMPESLRSTSAPGRGGRRLALDVHNLLRKRILNGEYKPGQSLLQAELARNLGVSRTPMREAFRLLQEEGLIEADPDQRARVRGVDPLDLDSIYATRIALETLAVTITLAAASEREIHLAAKALERMDAYRAEKDVNQWQVAHRDFHDSMSALVGPHLQRTIASLAQHSDRYVRLAQLGSTDISARAQEDHEQLLQAFSSRDEVATVQVLAAHLARTAISVLTDVAPDYEPAATRAALRRVPPFTI